MNNIERLYQEIIMDYNSRKDIKREIENPSLVSRGHNPSCGDDILIFLKIENDIIVDASYMGSACAISSASSAMLLDLIKGKSVKNSIDLINDFFLMMTNEEEEGNDRLEDAKVLKFVSKMPARIKCATLCWHSIKEMLENK